LQHLVDGQLKSNAALQCVKDEGSILIFDGDRGYGQRMAAEAMSVALSRCRDQGLVLMGLRNAHHIGRVGTYGEQALAAGFVSIHFVNVVGHDPVVAPYGGRAARLLTNPVCVAVPGTAHTPPVLLDFATSRIALGKVAIALHKEERLPPGLILDSTGEPTDDPAALFTEPLGALLPVGEHKGSGLALICELLAGVLMGGGTIQPGNPRSGGVENNMLSILIDPDRLGDRSWMGTELDALIAYVKSSPPAARVDEVLVAGEPEFRMRIRRSREGIPFVENNLEEVLLAAERVGIGRSEAAALLGLE